MPEKRLQIPPLRYAPVGMTRGEGFLSGRAASRMDRVGSDYSAKTADPSTALRSGRDDKGRGFSFRKGGESDGQSWE
jgi:hypothetical protein